jgi:cysteinyl-tRNA synthetase
MLSFYNTLSKSKEVFEPISPGKVGMYNCGPTVYDYVHIGNLRAYIFSDTLRRVLVHNGYDVNQVMNITDVGHLTSDADTGEDKMMKGLKREGLPVTLDGMHKLANIYTDAFLEDLSTLNILLPKVMPRASEHIKEQIEIIKRLEEKELIYSTSDGVYFSINDYPDYGKLGGISEDNEGLSRIEANPEKKNQRDFALWKFNPELGWESPWGRGFPGWHIECSAMSMKYLGETFDIHTGGVDHIATHHNGEIAQSEGATGKPFAHFWLHSEFINIDKEKISKSLGNTLTRKELETQNVSPLAYRYFILSAHYRTAMNFTWEAVEAAQTAYKRLRERVSELPEGGAINAEHDLRFLNAINDDLNTPQALALVWDLLKDAGLSDADKKATLLSWDSVLGLRLGAQEALLIPDDVQALLTQREAARRAKDWTTADTLRQAIEQYGYIVKDTPEGQKITKK